MQIENNIDSNSNSVKQSDFLSYLKSFTQELHKYKESTSDRKHLDKETIIISPLIINEILYWLRLPLNNKYILDNTFQNEIKKVFNYWSKSHFEYKNWAIYLIRRIEVSRANWLTKEKIKEINDVCFWNIKEKKDFFKKIISWIHINKNNKEELRIFFLGGFKKYLLNIVKIKLMNSLELKFNTDVTNKLWELDITSDDIQWYTQDAYREYFNYLNWELSSELNDFFDESDIKMLYTLFWIELLKFFEFNDEKINSIINESSQELLSDTITKITNSWDNSNWVIINAYSNLKSNLSRITKKKIFNKLKKDFNIPLENELSTLLTDLILKLVNKTNGLDVFSENIIASLSNRNPKIIQPLYAFFKLVNTKKEFKFSSQILRRLTIRETDTWDERMHRIFKLFIDTSVKKSKLTTELNKLNKNLNEVNEFNELININIEICKLDYEDVKLKYLELHSRYKKISDKVKVIKDEIDVHNSEDKIVNTFFWNQIIKIPKILDITLSKINRRLELAQKILEDNVELKNLVLDLKRLVSKKTIILNSEKNKIKPIRWLNNNISSKEFEITENDLVFTEIIKDMIIFLTK